MTTRAVTRKAYEVLENAPEGTPEGVYGHMYFEITVGSRTLCCALKPGVLPEEFVQTGRAIKKGNYSEQDARHWREQRTPSPRRFGIFLTLRMFCLFQ